MTALGLCAIFSSIGLAAGCGAASSTTAEPSPGTYAEVLAARYDDLFPDDRVLTVRITMADADWQSLQKDVTAKDYYRADISIDGEVIPDVAVRTKGGSSLMSAAAAIEFRAGLKVDFNFFNSARSYHGIKKMVYNNGFSDPTLMKDFLGYELMAEMGLPTPRACFVDLWVNGTHAGVYTQVEAIDAPFLSEHFRDGNGNLFKPEVRAGSLDWTEADVVVAAADPSSTTTTTTGSFNVGGGDLEELIDRLGDDAGWIPGRVTTTAPVESTTTTARVGPPGGQFVRPRDFIDREAGYLFSAGLRTNENSPDYSGLYRLLDVLNSDPDEVSMEDLENVLQVDEILRFLAVSVALVHLDNYIGMGHNYYLYEDGGRFSIIPWDLNMSFGGFDSGLSLDQILNFYIDEPTATAVADYPLVEQLLAEPEYLETYHGYLRDLIQGPFSVETMTARINEIADLIRPYAEKDDHMFYSIDEFERGLTQSLTGRASMRAMGGVFIGLVEFVKARDASIAAQLSGAEPAGSGNGTGNRGNKGLGIGDIPGLDGLPNGQPNQQWNRPGGAVQPDDIAPGGG